MTVQHPLSWVVSSDVNLQRVHREPITVGDGQTMAADSHSVGGVGAGVGQSDPHAASTSAPPPTINSARRDKIRMYTFPVRDGCVACSTGDTMPGVEILWRPRGDDPLFLRPPRAAPAPDIP